jgi:hypothetical protein
MIALQNLSNLLSQNKFFDRPYDHEIFSHPILPAHRFLHLPRCILRG